MRSPAHRLVPCLLTACLGCAGASVPLTSNDIDPPNANPSPISGVHPRAVGLLSVHNGGHGCAVAGTGLLKCWGDNASGELGLGDTIARGSNLSQMGNALGHVDLGRLFEVLRIATGTTITCAISTQGSVKCWGNNSSGQLGIGDTVPRGVAPGQMGDVLPAVALGNGHAVTQVAPGQNHVCALLDNGAVICWGANGLGQLGVGDTVTRGDSMASLGAALVPVNLGAGRTAVSMGAGVDFTCALLDNKQVKCWGANSLGQLGLGDTQPRGTAVAQMGDNLPAIALATGLQVTALAVGQSHACVILSDGSVKCWGDNSYCMLGLGDNRNRGDAADTMGDALSTIALGSGRRAIELAAGWGHNCAVLDDNTLKCWGYNFYGALGVGDGQSRGCAPQELGDALPPVELGDVGPIQSVHLGGVDTCVLLKTAEVKCWGYNVNGNLGLGDTQNRGLTSQSMGEQLPFVPLF